VRPRAAEVPGTSPPRPANRAQWTAQPADTITGLTIGGDDYITKPFSVEALVARVRAVLRRNQGLMLTRRQLLENVWGWGYAGQSQVLETYVRRIAPRSLPLRTRLLVGLIALTATFLVVMGAVTVAVLGTLDRNRLNAEVRLASRQSPAAGADRFSAAYLSLDGGTAGMLTATARRPPPPRC
jgi:hypothetical protein